MHAVLTTERSHDVDCAAFVLLFLVYRDGPATTPMLFAFVKITLIDAAVVANELSITFGLTVAKVTHVAASIFVYFDASSMFEAVAEVPFVNVTNVRAQDAIAKRFVVLPHA